MVGEAQAGELMGDLLGVDGRAQLAVVVLEALALVVGQHVSNCAHRLWKPGLKRAIASPSDTFASTPAIAHPQARRAALSNASSAASSACAPWSPAPARSPSA